MIAAIGTDGTRPVVWGLGATPRDAARDAREQDGCPAALTCAEVDDVRAERVRAGDVDASDLWPRRNGVTYERL